MGLAHGSSCGVFRAACKDAAAGGTDGSVLAFTLALAVLPGGCSREPGSQEMTLIPPGCRLGS